MSLNIQIESSSLTPSQKKIVSVIYIELKKNLITIIDSLKDLDIENIAIEDISKQMFVIISHSIKLVEKTKVNNKKIYGSDKKQIVLELGKILINTEINNTDITDIINPIYDTISEEILETIIDVSSHVNTNVKKGCMFLFNILKQKISVCFNRNDSVSS